MALIEDSSSKATAFYKEGDEVCGLKVGDIGTEQVDILADDGSAVTLKIREPVVFGGAE